MNGDNFKLVPVSCTSQFTTLLNAIATNSNTPVARSACAIGRHGSILWLERPELELQRQESDAGAKGEDEGTDFYKLKGLSIYNCRGNIAILIKSMNYYWHFINVDAKRTINYGHTC